MKSFIKLPSWRKKPLVTGIFCLMVTLVIAATITFKPAKIPQLLPWRDVQKSPSLTSKLYKMQPAEVSWSEKWIVITTTALPTKDVKFVASLKGWKVVVVGDAKTPANWSFPNCDFLSTETQKELNFSSTNLIPERSYTRKNIGYLYAIQHGAKVIYETDDDNRPTDRLHRFDHGLTFSGLEFAGERLFNPYHHFGQSTLWPRGYPLSKIAKESSRFYTMSQNMPTPLIQQGIVNGDSYMDAIFRLTRKKADTDLDVRFDPVAPTVSVPPGIFSPFNAQNTLFHYGAFWGLLLPSSKHLRVCDIWRGYWAQRLLWEINGRLAFYPPNAYQRRNSHSYLQDAMDEDPLYKQTEKLLDLLVTWTCPDMLSFFGCVEKLSTDMAASRFFKQLDVDLTKAWLADLTSIGYEEPTRNPLIDIQKPLKRFGKNRLYGNESYHLCFQRPKNSSLAPNYYKTNVIFFPVEQKSPVLFPKQESSTPNLWQQLSLLKNVCPDSEFFSSLTNGFYASKRINFFDDILLILSFNFSHFYQNIRYLEAAYRSIFPNIVYCGPDYVQFQRAVKEIPYLQQLSFIEADTSCGYLAYSCTIQAMRAGYNVSGYLHVADDVLINPWSFVGMNKSRVWMTKKYIFSLAEMGWYWWSTPPGEHAFLLSVNDTLKNTNRSRLAGDKVLIEYLKNVTIDKGRIMYGLSDVYYIPRRLETLAKYHLSTYYSRSLFLEIAIPVFCYGLEPASDILPIEGRSLQSHERGVKNIWDFFNPILHYLHPVKLSGNMESHNFCSKFMVALLNNSLYISHKALSLMLRGKL